MLSDNYIKGHKAFRKHMEWNLNHDWNSWIVYEPAQEAMLYTKQQVACDEHEQADSASVADRGGETLG